MSAGPLAVVTGAARRVGAATAEELARHGFDLLLVGRTGGRPLQATVDAARAAAAAQGRSIDVRTDAVDLADPASVVAFGERLSRLPGIDALVHNASSYDTTPLGAITDADFCRHMRVNAAAPLLLTQAAAGPLRRSRLAAGGAVVCFGDIHAMGRPRRSYAAYGASKAALGYVVESLARELAPHVRVNAIAPGVVAWPDSTSMQEREAYESRIPLARSGTPQEAAAMVRWLVLEATYMTGEILRLDGGRWLG